MLLLLLSMALCAKKERSPNPDKIPEGHYCVLSEEDPKMIYGAGDSYDNYYAMWMSEYDKTRDIAIDYRGGKAMYSKNNKYGWKFHANRRLAYGTTGSDGNRGNFTFERLNASDGNHVIKNYLGECLSLKGDKYSVFEGCGSGSTRYILIADCTKEILDATVRCLTETDRTKSAEMQCLAPGGPKSIRKDEARDEGFDSAGLMGCEYYKPICKECYHKCRLRRLYFHH